MQLFFYFSLMNTNIQNLIVFNGLRGKIKPNDLHFFYRIDKYVNANSLSVYKCCVSFKQSRMSENSISKCDYDVHENNISLFSNKLKSHLIYNIQIMTCTNIYAYGDIQIRYITSNFPCKK